MTSKLIFIFLSLFIFCSSYSHDTYNSDFIKYDMEEDLDFIFSIEDLIIKSYSFNEINNIIKACASESLLCNNSLKWNYLDILNVISFMLINKKFISEYTYEETYKHSISSSLRLKERVDYLTAINFWEIEERRVKILLTFFSKFNHDEPELPFPLNKTNVWLDYHPDDRESAAFYINDIKYTVCDVRNSDLGQNSFWKLIIPIEDMKATWDLDYFALESEFEEWLESFDTNSIETEEYYYFFSGQHYLVEDSVGYMFYALTRYFKVPHRFSIFFTAHSEVSQLKIDIKKYRSLFYLIELIQNHLNKESKSKVNFYEYIRSKNDSFYYQWEFLNDVFSKDACL